MNGEKKEEIAKIYKLLRPILFNLDAEPAHHLVFSSAKFLQSTPGLDWLYKAHLNFHYGICKYSRLKNKVFDLEFGSPFGIAAGFDKNAELIPTLSRLGFGFLELGSVTNQVSKGNPKPRMFRLPDDEAIINRLGLNNNGPAEFIRQLEKEDSNLPLAINIAKTHSEEILGEEAIADIVDCYTKVSGKAQLVVFNVSCPNTKEGKTFEDPDSLQQLLKEISEVRTGSLPHLVKLSPDSDEGVFKELLEIVETNKMDGLVISNTSSERNNLKSSNFRIENIGRGGLSGPPIAELSIAKVRLAYQTLAGRLPIIGLGGINSAEVAYSYIKAGASLLELYTALVYEGPGLVKRLNKGLDKLLAKDGYENISEAIGKE